MNKSDAQQLDHQRRMTANLFLRQTVENLLEKMTESGEPMKSLVMSDAEGNIIGAFVALQGPSTARYLEAIQSAMPASEEMTVNGAPAAVVA